MATRKSQVATAFIRRRSAACRTSIAVAAVMRTRLGRQATSAAVGRARSQDAELVALRIGHDHPGDLITLTDVGTAGAERLEPRHLGGLVVRPEVEVQPVLPGL